MRRREPISLDITSLIDIIFIVIIFFIVTSSFKKEHFALNITLPSATAKEIKIDTKQLIIEVNKEKLAYMGKKITFLELQKKLELIKNHKLPVVVKIDKTVPYKRVIEVLDILQLNNLNNLALVTSDK